MGKVENASAQTTFSLRFAPQETTSLFRLTLGVPLPGMIVLSQPSRLCLQRLDGLSTAVLHEGPETGR